MNVPVCPEHGPMRPTARHCPAFYCRACRERALARERAETPQIADAYIPGESLAAGMPAEAFEETVAK